MQTPVFRGKRKDNNEWVMGSHFCMRHTDSRTHVHHFIIPTGVPLPKECPIGDIQVEVYPETIGQYIGEDDREGNAVFQHDIVSNGRVYAEVVFTEGAFQFKSSSSLDFFEDFSFFCTFIVLGNIHDNPELLEESD